MQGARSVALAHHLSAGATLTHESRAMAVEQLAADRLGEHIGGVECGVDVLDVHLAEGLQLAHLIAFMILAATRLSSSLVRSLSSSALISFV